MSINEKMTALADAVRAKTGQTGKLSIDAMTTAVNNMSTGVELPELTNEGVAADVLSGKEFIDSNGNVVTGTMLIYSGDEVTLDVTNTTHVLDDGYYEDCRVSIELEEKTVTPTDTQQIITPTAGKVLSKVTVEAASGGGASVETCTVGFTYFDYVNGNPCTLYYMKPDMSFGTATYQASREEYIPATVVTVLKNSIVAIVDFSAEVLMVNPSGSIESLIESPFSGCAFYITGDCTIDMSNG